MSKIKLSSALQNKENVPKIVAGNVDGEVIIDKDGLKQSGQALQYMDLPVDFIGRRLYSNTGTVDTDWDRNVTKFQKNGSLSSKNNRIQGSVSYNHFFKFSKNQNDLIKVYPHFHWHQYNDTDKYTISIKYRISSNGVGYKDDGSDWTTVSVDTCSGNDIFAFDLNGKDYMVQITEFPEIQSYIGLSAEFEVMITRIDGNSFANDLYMKRFDWHCPVAKLGSNNPYTD